MDLQGEAGSVLGDGRYPVNCLGMNRSSFLAVGDCGGGLRIYHVQSALKVVLITSIDLASIFAKKIQTDEVSLLNILIPVDGHFLGPGKSRL